MKYNQIMNFTKCLQFVLLYLLTDIIHQSTTTIRSDRNKLCGRTSILRNDNNGLIESHSDFGVQSYPNNLDCDYLIIAPATFKIVIQFNFINIEKDNSCSLDYVEFENMPTGSRIRMCGEDDDPRFISQGNQIIIRFHSDETVTMEGFSLRYFFVSSELYRAGLVPRVKTGRFCVGDEFKCLYGDTCIQKEWICDGIRDCRDNSDEQNCPNKQLCHATYQMSCQDGRQCVSRDKWCNGKVDCKDGSDELSRCNRINVPVYNITDDNQSNFTADNDKCSYQPIRPVKINITNNENDPQIIKGMAARPFSWPWMASLRYGTFHMCGASLITTKWAITAAHCVSIDTDPTKWRIELGRFLKDGDNKTKNQTILVERIEINPKFKIWTMSHDVALLKLVTEVTKNDKVQSICLPKQSVEPHSHQKCVIIGWGYTGDTGGEGVLKQALVPVVNRKNCRKTYGSIIDNSMLCAGYKKGGVDACQGDSGGPLMCLEKHDGGEYLEKYLLKLYGIVSWGEGCAIPNKPGVYTSVVSVLQWIHEIIDEQFNTSTVSFTFAETAAMTKKVTTTLQNTPTIIDETTTPLITTKVITTPLQSTASISKETKASPSESLITSEVITTPLQSSTSISKETKTSPSPNEPLITSEVITTPLQSTSLLTTETISTQSKTIIAKVTAAPLKIQLQPVIPFNKK